MKFVKIFMVIFFLVVMGFSSAHLGAGEDLKKDGYIIDFGYSPKAIKSGYPVNFAINLVNETTKKPVEITSIWTRISKNEEILFAGEIAAEDSSVVFSYVPAYSGNYVFDFEFRQGNKVLEKQNFDLDIKKSDKNIYLIAGLIGLIIIVFCLRKFKGK